MITLLQPTYPLSRNIAIDNIQMKQLLMQNLTIAHTVPLKYRICFIFYFFLYCKLAFAIMLPLILAPSFYPSLVSFSTLSILRLVTNEPHSSLMCKPCVIFRCHQCSPMTYLLQRTMRLLVHL